MVDFAELKRRSGNLENAQKAVEALKTTYDNADDSQNYWKPRLDKSGIGQAVIRFLPAQNADGDGSANFVRYYNHGFKENEQWLIENCPTTKGVGTPCPVCESNTELWAKGDKVSQDIVRERKRKLNYVSNIYVVSDPANKDNEGKVFLYRYGQKIMDKIEGALNPAFAGEPKFDAFDMWAGADFLMRITNTKQGWNYDNSKFDNVTAMDDKVIEKAYVSTFSLKEVISDSKFKSYEDIKKRLDKVLGTSPAPFRSNIESAIPAAAAATPVAAAVSRAVASQPVVDEEDDMSMFDRLANED